MKKSVKTIGTIATIVIMSVCSYMAGTTQAKTETVTKTVTKEVEVIPDNYISLDKCIPLDDVAYYYINSYGYPCFELKDTRYQLNNSSNMSYDDILNDLPLDTEYQNDCIDMKQVTDFTATENSLQLYTADGNGYYWEK